MPDSETEQARAELVMLLADMLADHESDARDRANQIADTLKALYGIDATTVKLNVYNGLTHQRDLAIAIPESSWNNLLSMIRKAFS